jgi:hypothetical protein
MNPSLLPERDLATLTGHLGEDGRVDRGQLKRCLARARVPYRVGAGGQVWTTVEALNAALLGSQVEGAPRADEPYDPDKFG